MIEIIEDVTPAVKSRLGFVWLEITGRCQLECIHCYADSGPTGTHGNMTAEVWRRVIDECATLGVSMVQFIGGEPTLHPDLTGLIDHALGQDLDVEVFTNLVHISDAMWKSFERPGVRLACSWYSTDPRQHLQIVQRNTHARTKANLAEAIRRIIPVRAGVVGMLDGQDIEAATADLAAMGVADIGVDHLRQVGRGIRDREASVAELCGNCGDGVVAIGPDGSVWPCVFTRWMPVGNVQTASLDDIISGSTSRQAIAGLRAEFDVGPENAGYCTPRCVPKTQCDPRCGPSCSPACRPLCIPKGGPCAPRGGCQPSYLK
jgi:MoaA/NifB/PqqE/SkfB family radical SAM enzyme